MKYLLLSILILISCLHPKTEIKKGQIWIMVFDEKDPFKKTDTLRANILEYRSKYVQYTLYGKGFYGKFITSDSESKIRRLFKCLEGCD